MKGFKIAIIIWALLPIITGVMDVIVGPSAWQGIGVGLSAQSFGDSVLDSQVRFLGTVWISYGALLLVCVKDLQKYANILRGALLVVFIGGIARVISVAQVGMPDTEAGPGFIVFALVIELAVMPALLLWQHKVMKSDPL